ncbi:hypothetical protein LCGC14_2452830, partial [marine sediment metagenome]
TEVPPPGGADHTLDDIAPPSPEAARRTIQIHREVFAKAGLTDAFSRVLGVVVQPGVEFGNRNTVRYDSHRAQALSAVLNDAPGLVFEAHSTDYQGTAPLAALVRDGFPILKVGPELTFVLREALYALDLIAGELLDDYPPRQLARTMERIMCASPDHWQRHYSGSGAALRVLRHYSLSDRIRYYWPEGAAQDAVETLLSALRGQCVPRQLFWQYLPAAQTFADAPLNPEDLLIWRVSESLKTYHAACHPTEHEG